MAEAGQLLQGFAITWGTPGLLRGRLHCTDSLEWRREAHGRAQTQPSPCPLLFLLKGAVLAVKTPHASLDQLKPHPPASTMGKPVWPRCHATRWAAASGPLAHSTSLRGK
jgi:hypothetical protein